MQIVLPVVSRFLVHQSLSAQARDILRSIHCLTHPSRLTLEIQDCKTEALSNIHTPEIQTREGEELETADTSTQTDKISEEKMTLNGNDERLQELERTLSKARQSENAAKAEILRKDIEISRLKILSDKRPLQENGASSEVSPSKKAKTQHKVENNTSQEEIFPSSTISSSSHAEGQLSVEEMMKDFSDKLNDNIVPRNFANDSDSE